MTRFTVGVALVLSVAGGIARAETQAEIAARDNEDGKTLMFAGNYKDASAKFHDAVARVPEAKYFFNLCTSLYQEGKFGEALTACQSAEKNNPDDALKGKISKLEGKIDDEAKAQGIVLAPVGGGGDQPTVPDPNNGGTSNPSNPSNPTNPTNPPTNPTDPNAGKPPGQPVYAVGKPPSQGLFTQVAPSHDYTWALGIDLFGGGANVGGKDASGQNIYGSAAGGFRIKADYMVAPRSRVGLQGYVQATNITAGSSMTGFPLDIIDVGGAVYKHFCPRGGRLCFTPLGGLQIALMDPNDPGASGDQTFNYAALGVRGEGNLSFEFGPRHEYVLQAMIGFNFYTKAFAAPSDPGMTAADVGLDKGGPTLYLGAGFTYRFNTPFGQAPFVTLE